VSDFGFDAYALDDLDTTGHPHPLEIARDLIAAGKPRAALEVLSHHRERLLDDPEYLLLCSEAWRADGDTLRAQQALLGAARLAPQDPRPLQCLGELLAERGEHDKAEQILAKASALEDLAAGAEEPLETSGPEGEDDLIAFAERQERSQQGALTPKQILLGVVLLIGIAALVGAIAFVTQTDETAAPAEGFAPAPAPTEPEPAAASIPDGELEPTSPTETGEPELLDPLPAPVVLAAPTAETPRKAASPPRGSAPAAEVPASPDPKPPKSAAPVAKSRPKTLAGPRTPPSTKEPDDAVVQAELASMQPDELTARADALYAQGHSALASSYYRRALEIDPDYAPALVGIGQSILRAKKYSEAMRNATRALQLARGVDARPGLEAAAIYQLGRVHYERGERDAARHLFRQSISLPGTPAEAWFYLGEALSSDNSPAARQAYEKYLELVSDGHLADRARRAIQ
jgi:tetratricopeptide (TPR) repeat protein